MPGGDQTGPQGIGQRTGRGMGDCTGTEQPHFFGGGFGRGRGWRHWARATGLPRWMRWGSTAADPMDEATRLKEQAEQLQTQLNAIQQRLTDLERK